MTTMTITDYLINAVFVLIVLSQARERELDRLSFIIPLAIIAYVAHIYVHSIPTSGNDLVLIAALGTVGLTLGVASGLATHVRAGENGLAVARVGWLAGALLIAGISSRMVFVFAIHHGARRAVASFSMAHQIGAAAWPVALVLMALLEVATRIAIVQLRGHRAMQSSDTAIAAVREHRPFRIKPFRPAAAGRSPFYRASCGDRFTAIVGAGQRAGSGGTGACSGALASAARDAAAALLGVLFVVVLGSANSHPVPGLHGKALAVTVALSVFAVALLVAVADGFPERSVGLQTAVIAVIGAAGVAIAGLQPKGASEVAAGVAVFMAIARLPFKRRCRDRWRGDRRAGCGHGGGRKLLVGYPGRNARDGSWSVSSRCSSSSLGRARTGPRSCWRSLRTRVMSRPARRRSPSAAGSPQSCTMCSRTRSLAPPSSSRAPGSSLSASTLSHL